MTQSFFIPLLSTLLAFGLVLGNAGCTQNSDSQKQTPSKPVEGGTNTGGDKDKDKDKDKDTGLN